MAKKSSFLVLPHDLLDSPAFHSLNRTAVHVFFRFLRKRRLTQVKRNGRRTGSYIITNQGEIEYTYAEAENKDGIHRPRFSAALKMLVERGFISVAEEGGLFRRITKYRVHVPDNSEPWRDWKI